MLPVWRKSGVCIFCALRCFTTSSTLGRASQYNRGSRGLTPLARSVKGQRNKGQRTEYRIRNASKSPHIVSRGDYPALYPREVSFKPVIGKPTFTRKTQEPDPTQSVDKVLREVQLGLSTAPIFKGLHLSSTHLQRLYKKFRRHLDIQLRTNEDPCLTTRHSGNRLKKLLELVTSGQEDAAHTHVKLAFYDHLLSLRVPEYESPKPQKLESLTDMSQPYEWFPATRAYPREIHVHIGPTNSGKTYQALKRLEECETGVYAGPLRLLAHEIYMRLNAKNQRCNLVTGDDRRAADQDDPHASKMSCTVEMVPLNTAFDVAVIDEIQMLGSPDRGWAWTQAFLGVMAKEVHVCGEERSVSIIQQLAAACCEKVHIHRYKRLSPLKLAGGSLNGDLRELRKGDCIVAFSIVVLHSLRQEIEKTSGKKCAIIYGSLPPETRAQQAALFNDQNNDYDFLVASNAVGMGLNLSIKRLVFQSLHRTVKQRFIPIEVPEVKQIAGRAGRYSTASDDIKSNNLDQENLSALDLAQDRSKQIGFVTTLERYDFPRLKEAMNTLPQPLRAAGLFPPAFIIERFARYFPLDTPFSFLLFRMSELAETGPRFFVCDLTANIAIADTIGSVKGLSIKDREIFCSAPIEPKKPGEIELARAYAQCIADCTGKSVLDFEELDIELLEDKYEPSREYLQRIERLHKSLVIFMWLSYRFHGLFLDRELAMHIRSLTEKRIEDTLAHLSFDFNRFRKKREQAILEMLHDGSPEEDAELNDTNSLGSSPAIDQNTVPAPREKTKKTLETIDNRQQPNQVLLDLIHEADRTEDPKSI